MNGKPTIHLIHGFNEDHDFGDPDIKIMKEVLENETEYNVHVWDYGHTNLISVRTSNDNYARLIGSSVEYYDILIGYSNGCLIIKQIVENLRLPVKALVLLHPALPKNWLPPPWVQRVFIFFNAGDKVVTAGKWWNRATKILPWNWGSKNTTDWGELGRTGYKGVYDPRVRQYDTLAHPVFPKIEGHGALFSEAGYPWFDWIAGLINDLPDDL